MRAYLRRLLPYVRPYGHLAAASLVLMIGASLVGLLSPWPLQILVDSVIGQAPLPTFLAAFVGAESPHRIVLLLLVVGSSLLIATLGSALNVVNSAVDTKLEQLVILDFRSDLFRHAQRLSVPYRDQISAARLMYGINFEAAAAGSLIMALQPLAQAGLTIVGMVWISFQIDPLLALLSITIVPLLYYSIRYYAT